MTNIQLYLAIGIPSFLVILSWISNNIQYGHIDKHFTDLEARMDKRFAAIEARITDLEKKIDARLLIIEGDLRQFFSVTGKLDGRLDEISKKGA